MIDPSQLLDFEKEGVQQLKEIDGWLAISVYLWTENRKISTPFFGPQLTNLELNKKEEIHLATQVDEKAHKYVIKDLFGITSSYTDTAE